MIISKESLSCPVMGGFSYRVKGNQKKEDIRGECHIKSKKLSYNISYEDAIETMN